VVINNQILGTGVVEHIEGHLGLPGDGQHHQAGLPLHFPSLLAVLGNEAAGAGRDHLSVGVHHGEVGAHGLAHAAVVMGQPVAVAALFQWLWRGNLTVVTLKRECSRRSDISNRLPI
jgi:hypothetical protein